jgi:hypothetical protein
VTTEEIAGVTSGAGGGDPDINTVLFFTIHASTFLTVWVTVTVVVVFTLLTNETKSVTTFVAVTLPFPGMLIIWTSWQTPEYC